MLLWFALVYLLDCAVGSPSDYLGSYNYIRTPSQGFYPSNLYQFDSNNYTPRNYKQSEKIYHLNQPAIPQTFYPARHAEFHSSFYPSRQVFSDSYYPLNQQQQQSQYVKHQVIAQDHYVHQHPYVHQHQWAPENVYKPGNDMHTLYTYAPQYYVGFTPKVIDAKPPPPKNQEVVSPPPPPRLKYPDAKTYLMYNTKKNKHLYKFGYQQTDGQRREEEGELVSSDNDDENLSVKGSYGWMGPDGVNYTVNYTADENGYQPDISQGPGGGVPPAVVASLLG